MTTTNDGGPAFPQPNHIVEHETLGRVEATMRNKTRLTKDIENLINIYSAENGSNTPDFILAEFLIDCLEAWNKAVTAREKWYGRGPKPANVAPTERPSP